MCLSQILLFQGWHLLEKTVLIPPTHLLSSQQESTTSSFDLYWTIVSLKYLYCKACGFMSVSSTDCLTLSEEMWCSSHLCVSWFLAVFITLMTGWLDKWRNHNKYTRSLRINTNLLNMILPGLLVPAMLSSWHSPTPTPSQGCHLLSQSPKLPQPSPWRTMQEIPCVGAWASYI